MVAQGNVGPSLTSYETSNTYITRDGGSTWKEIRVGPHLNTLADHGAILGIVNDLDPTRHIR